MIEYIPGQYCWRPAEARGYMFIPCIFVDFKRAYKGKGYGSLLVDECVKDVQNSPCAFGPFCTVYNVKAIAPHPIGNTRFINIMNKVLT